MGIGKARSSILLSLRGYKCTSPRSVPSRRLSGYINPMHLLLCCYCITMQEHDLVMNANRMEVVPHLSTHTFTTTLFISPDLLQLHFLKSVVILEGVRAALTMLTRSVGLHIGLLIFLVSVQFGWDLNTG